MSIMHATKVKVFYNLSHTDGRSCGSNFRKCSCEKKKEELINSFIAIMARPSDSSS